MFFFPRRGSKFSLADLKLVSTLISLLRKVAGC